MFPMSSLHFPSPPYPADGTPLNQARWRQSYSKPTLDDIWLLRAFEEKKRNRARHKDWETRFKVLGPRPAVVAAQ